MIKEIIATGVDANAAIESGALLLGLPREEVQFEIIDLPRKGGFLGLKKLPAKVRVWVELPDEKPARAEKTEKPRRQEAPKKEQKPAAPKAERSEKPARTEKTEKPAPKAEKAEKQPKAERPPRPEKVEKVEKAEKPAAEPKPVLVEVEPTEEVRAKVEKAAAYVTEILGAMGLSNFTVTPRYYEENVRLQLTGEQIGSVIGRRGETLDAIQYLASLVANRGEGEYIRLSIDSGNYREKRARTLEALARKLANQAVRTGRSVTLEPMNPYERRVIHATIQGIEGVTSSSIGDEPSRRGVISSTNPPQKTYNRRIIHGAVSSVKGATSSSTGVEPNRRVVISSTVAPAGGKEGGKEGGRGGRGRGGNRRGNGGNSGRSNGGERRSRPAGERRPRLEDPPAIGGPVRREPQPETAPKAEKSTVEQEILSANTGKRYGKIDI